MHQDTSKEIIFDGKRLYAGVVYHLLDMKLGEYVDLDSYEFHVARHMEMHPVCRFDWRHWNDTERLKWLYSKIHSEAHLSKDGMLFFLPRQEPVRGIKRQSGE